MKKIIISVVLSIFVFILFCFRIGDSLIFHSDFARDLYEILKISKGNLTLLGPKFSFGGLYSAPYYFYLFVPVFLLSGFKIMSVVYFNLWLFFLGIGYFFLQARKRYPQYKAFLASLAISLLPLYLFAARNPGNANTHIAFLLILLTYIYFNKIEKIPIVIILGTTFGIIINFSFVNLILLIPVFILLAAKMKNKVLSLYFFVGIVLSFLPLMVFELKNNFVILRSFAETRSYLSWIENSNIIGGDTGNKNFLINFFSIGSKMKELISFNPITGLFGLLLIKLFEKSPKRELLLSILGFIVLIITSFLLKFQLAPHYLYPTAFFIFFVIIISILRSRFPALLVFLIILELVFFNRGIYGKSTIGPEPFEQAVKYVIDNNIVDKKTKFNLIMIGHPNAILGYEYRYFFAKNDFYPMSEFEYAASDTLLIFTKKDINPLRINSWELDQFGKDNLSRLRKYRVGKTHILKGENN